MQYAGKEDYLKYLFKSEACLKVKVTASSRG